MAAFMRPLLGHAQRERESLLWRLPCKLSSKVEHESMLREVGEIILQFPYG